jgi:glycosyltransferase involved in cell wall biosynthesis
VIIGVELRHIVLGQSGGVAQLIKGVLEPAITQGAQDRFLLFCTPFNRDLVEIPRAANVTAYTLPLDRYYAEIDRISMESGVDVLFRGYPEEDTLTFPVAKQIFLIPDLQHERFPEFFAEDFLRSRRAAFLKAQGAAGAIAAISEHSRQTILASPHTRCTDVFLMPPALQREHRDAVTDAITDEELAALPTRPYFLFPANMWRHKNHRVLIEGFRRFVDKGYRDHELVLTGHPDGWSQLHDVCDGLRIRHLGFVRPPLMRVLFERAQALTYFSLYEGFGMPLLEAFDAGTPVLCSNTTSLPEVGGDAVLTCNPEDPEAIAALMATLADDPGLRTRLTERGRRRLAEYDWTISAQRFLDGCRRVTHGSNAGTLSSVSAIARDPQSSGEPASNSEVTAASLPLVSIVTPSFNQGVYLRRTIDSVLSQSYSNIELIVMDGGSTDDSVSILKDYNDRITWVSEPDNGQTHAINKGMRRARGEILAYLNSDDVLLPGAIERVVEYFANHPPTMMVYGKAFYIDEVDRITGDYRTEPYSRERLAEECIICQPATFWRRSLTALIGDFDERLHFVMDYDYWLRAANAGARIDFLDEPLASSRRYPETKTLSARGKIYREIFDMCWRHNKYIGRDYVVGYWHHIMWERAPRLRRAAAWLNYDYVAIGDLHYRYLTWIRDQRTRFRNIADAVRNRLQPRTALTAPTGSPAMDAGAPTRVTGFASDNWVHSSLHIARPRRALGACGYLQGVSPTDQTVQVVVNDQIVATYKLSARACRRLEVEFPTGDVSSLRFVFSGNRSDATGRTFLLEATNLFSEQDMVHDHSR